MDHPSSMDLNYSLKNIPLPPARIYLKSLVEKVESVVRRMRWKAHFFLTGQTQELDNSKFGFQSTKSPPQVEEMKAFEEDLTSLVRSVKFRKVSDPFQDKLQRDLASITSTDDIIVKADKTKNIYRMPKDRYRQLLRENITKNYKAAPDTLLDDINSEASKIAAKLELDDRMETLAKADAFLTLKDHKPRFKNDLPCRLINPAKPEIGMISKAILDRITDAARDATNANLWKNSASVIEWFKGIKDKDRCTFVCFDIVEFYPSITEELLRQALTYAQQFTAIDKDEIDVIMHARKSLLFENGRPWMKREKDNAFDVTMGSFDGAEICELVGLFLLNQLPNSIHKSSVGLYRDDGLGALKGASGSQADRTRKSIIDVFKKFGLRITIDVNLRVANFLDVTYNLSTGKYEPYRKPGDSPLYLNSQSNHPPVILKNLPHAIERRVSSISADSKVFATAAPLYSSALAMSGFPHKLEYVEESAPSKKRQRRRNIVWFNPPYSKNVETNVGAAFLRLINKHFPRNSPLHKIFNRNTLKVSYSCLPNVAAYIRSHNRRQLETPDTPNPCNCRVKANCPLQGQCQTKGVVYKAEVSTNEPRNHPVAYIGATEPSFKARFANHQTSLRHEKYRNATELSKYAWQLKEKGKDFSISWKILQRARPYSNIAKRCSLCLAEKTSIILAKDPGILNSRTELVSKCRHANKFKLKNFCRVT